MWLFPDHQVGYCDGPGQPYEDIDNPAQHPIHNVVPFPDSPRGQRQQQLEDMQSPLPLMPTAPLRYNSLNTAIEQLHGSAEPSVIEEVWHEYVKATGWHL